MASELRIYSKNFAGIENNKHWLNYEVDGKSIFSAFFDRYDLYTDRITMYTDGSFCELTLNAGTKIRENLTM